MGTHDKLALIILLVMIFSSPIFLFIRYIWRYYVFPYLKTKDMVEYDKDIFLSSYFENLSIEDGEGDE